jgi:hypothetical protein
MTDRLRSLFSTPRLFVVGLIVFAACHRQPTQTAPPPAPTPAPKPVPAPPTEVTVSSAPALIQTMHDRYASTWYRTVTFTQKTTLGLASGGELVQTWYEAGQLPGRLRIDTDRASKGGVLYVRDSTFSFTNGKLVKADTGLNELLVLGFDVYVQSAARSEAILRRLGFDLTRLHRSTWQGKPVYVVGAVAGDTMSKQFWVDRERLLFVRMIERTPRGRTEIRFNNYVQYGGGWLALEVEQIVNGKRRVLEQYSDVKTNASLSDALFDPKQWATAPHWAPPKKSRRD